MMILFNNLIKEIGEQEKTNVVSKHEGIPVIKKVVELGDAKLKDIINKSENIKREMKGSITGKLGQGSYGIAYSLSNSSVAKFTGDSQEASTSYAVKNAKNKHIIRIDEVVEIVLSPKNGGAKIYMILEEKLNVDENDNLDILLSFVDGIKKEFPEFKDEGSGKIMDLIDNLSLKNNVKLINLANSMQKKYGLHKELTHFIIDVSSGLRYLKSLGIEWKDLHHGNVGQRGNDYVLFDFGLSKSPGGPETIKKSIEESYIV